VRIDERLNLEAREVESELKKDELVVGAVGSAGAWDRREDVENRELVDNVEDGEDGEGKGLSIFPLVGR
jgi:hypothetical protein